MGIYLYGTIHVIHLDTLINIVLIIGIWQFTSDSDWNWHFGTWNIIKLVNKEKCNGKNM